MKLGVWRKQLLARWYYLVGKAYRHFGNQLGIIEQYETAVDYFTQAVQLDPTFAEVYLDRGILYWRELDHPRRAVIDLTTAYDLAPQLIEARFNRGVAYQQLREYHNAVEDFEAYLALGKHPYWREHAEKMVKELSEWTKPDEAFD